MKFEKLKLYWRECLYIINRHNMNCMSAQLTYGVTVAIVPFFAVLFVFIHSRKNFEQIFNTIIKPLIYDYFGIRIGGSVAEYLQSVIVNVQYIQLSIVSLVSFVVTVILLLLLLESVFDTLLDNKNPRNIFVRVVKCWVLLACSPFLFLLVTVRSDFFIKIFDIANQVLVGEDVTVLRIILGYLSQVVLFSIIYWIMPSRSLKIFPVILGSCFTTLALNVIRSVNAYLVKITLHGDPSQIYGNLPLIAILFFVWLRLMIFGVLLGFVVAVAFQRSVFRDHTIHKTPHKINT